jgi:hypothetical protein
LFEENPDMPAITGTRPFQRGWDVEPATGLEKSGGIILPLFPVEIDGSVNLYFQLEDRPSDSSSDRSAHSHKSVASAYFGMKSRWHASRQIISNVSQLG